jgi:FtsP/CotA-like multicopper oxidase with cupredoxin domain
MRLLLVSLLLICLTIVAEGAVPSKSGRTREYWIAVESVRWNIAPGPDQLSGQRLAPELATFNALRMRAYTRDFGAALPADPTLGLAGPTIEAEVGDTVIVHFKNLDQYYRQPHSLHVHGLLYDVANDGGYMRTHASKPGTAILFGQTFTYVWKALPGSVGVWPYHDHSVQSERNIALGMFGAVRVRQPGEKRPDHEYYLFFSGQETDVTGLPRDYDTINGLAYTGNTPTLTATLGDKVRINVLAMGTEFHTFHIHGYRWTESGRPRDSQMVGPATTWWVDLIADNPGMWMYQCHVSEHLQNGMAGTFQVLRRGESNSGMTEAHH